MTISSPSSDSDSETEGFLDNLNDVRRGTFILDINYNRPLKNFPLSLNKIEEVDETSVKSSETSQSKERDENGNLLEEAVNKIKRVEEWREKFNEEKNKTENSNRLHVGWKTKLVEEKSKKPRPRSAGFVDDSSRLQKDGSEVRSRSSCADYPSRIPVKQPEQPQKIGRRHQTDSDSSSNLSATSDHRRPKSADARTQSKPKSYESDWESFYLREVYEDDYYWMNEYPVRPKSACNMRRPNHQKRHRAKRSNSQPDINSNGKSHMKKIWCDATRYKRSLRLLGLSQSDFGLPESPRMSPPVRPRSCHQVSPTFQTKVLQRSISLECLREVIRGATHYGFPGLPERQLLSTAAYEEWYFKKTEESKKKLEETRRRQEKLKQDFENEEETKRQKADEQFHKWLTKKRQVDRQNKIQVSNSRMMDGRLAKSKEEIEKVYKEWKKAKQKDFDKKREQLKSEAEKEERLKIQKEERRAQAQKVFQEWKRKREETQKLEREKAKKAKEGLREKLKAKKKTNTSFQTWKDLKDDQIKARFKKQMEEAKLAEVKRTIIITERMYEAEQAFEDWLDRVDSRRITNHQKPQVPWAPV